LLSQILFFQLGKSLFVLDYKVQTEQYIPVTFQWANCQHKSNTRGVWFKALPKENRL